MKPLVRKLLCGGAVLGCLVLLAVGDRIAARNRHEVTCKGVEATIADSLQRKFITPDDVKDWMADYGTYMGLRLDSIDLRRVEEIIDHKSAVRKSQAWLTDDGLLHISVTQREPLVRFQGAAGGFYADREGYLFPLQARHTARVPIVDGDLPIRLEKDFKGEPETEEERAWVESVLGLVRYLNAHKEWNDLVGEIHVRKDGNLVLIPREGAERFLFGSPTAVEAKFGRIRKYYEAVAPLGNDYRTVDVRYRDQIICKKK